MLYAKDADALLCDLAQTYNVYSFDTLPVQTLAILASGLPETARVRRRSAQQTDTMLLAAAVDRLSLLVWAQTKDGPRGIHKPKSVFEALFGKKEDTQPVQAFRSPSEFERAREKILGE